MPHRVYRYSFPSSVPMSEVRDTLRLAALATESVFGRRRVLLEADFDLSDDERACWFDTSTEVGRHLHQVFRGYACREFGPGSFRVSKVLPETLSMNS